MRRTTNSRSNTDEHPPKRWWAEEADYHGIWKRLTFRSDFRIADLYPEEQSWDSEVPGSMSDQIRDVLAFDAKAAGTWLAAGATVAGAVVLAGILHAEITAWRERLDRQDTASTLLRASHATGNDMLLVPLGPTVLASTVDANQLLRPGNGQGAL